MRTNVYIDGFNLYFRALVNTPYKWLDLRKLCQALPPSHQINRIRYFTALVEQRDNDPQQPRRQLTYLRAIETIPDLSIHYGQFRTRRKWRPLVKPIPGTGRTVEIWNTEEKGSDVNLATYLLIDGYENDYEQALVISNDSDLALPVRAVRDHLTKPIGIVNPSPTNTRKHPNPTPKELRDAATFLRRIRVKALRNCQLPQTIRDAYGSVAKPSSW